MKITEVTRQNKSWATLSGFDLTIEDIYYDLISVMKIIISTNSRYRSSQIAHTVENFESRLIGIMNFNFSNYPNPDDMNVFKKKCKKMLSNTQYLKSKLP